MARQEMAVPTRRSPASRSASDPMKIATFNVNGVNGRLPRLLEWLEETRPDVACLQEIKTGDATLPGERARSRGLRRRSGTASARTMASRSSRAGDAPRRDAPRRCPATTTTWPRATSKPRSTACASPSVYLPNGNPVPSANFDYKLRWMRALDRARADAHRLRHGPSVLAGDFNVVPTNFDIYNAGSWRFDAVLQPRDARALRRACWRRAGSTPRATLHPEERIYTFWVNAAAFHAQRRLPHGLPAADARRSCRGCARRGVDAEHRGREKPSDHAPVWIKLDG